MSLIIIDPYCFLNYLIIITIYLYLKPRVYYKEIVAFLVLSYTILYCYVIVFYLLKLYYLIFVYLCYLC